MTYICPKCRTRFEQNVQRCPHDKRRVVVDLAGQTVAGRYLLKELLGVGGMDSSVWMAVQAPIQRPVAIKLLPPAEGESADRFARGARIASNLNHPNITVVHDYGVAEDGHLYLVMELLQGRTLHEVLRAGPLGVERALSITDQVLKALDHAHKKKVVHRDIKPGNLFLTAGGDDDDEFVKVLDFGIARFIDPSDSFGEEPGEEITTARQICGTPQYMAPEQIAMANVDGRTDLYALGVVLYRMLTGVLPFRSKDHRELFRAHLTQTPPSFAATRAGIDAPDLEALVMRSLAKSPDDRFASPSEMRRALRQLRFRRGVIEDELTPLSGAVSAPASLGSETVSIATPKRSRTPLLIALILLVGVGLAILLLSGSDPLKPTAPPSVASAQSAASKAPTLPAAPVTQAPQTGASPSDAGLADMGTADAAPPDAAPPSIAAAPPSQAATGMVKITSAPAGATVWMGDTALGKTPLTVSLPVGAHRLRLGRGRYVATLRVTAVAGETVERFHAKLRRRGRRAPATEAPKPVAVESVAPATVAAPVTQAPKKTVRVKLLDEDAARDFKSGSTKPAAPATRKPSINLLE